MVGAVLAPFLGSLAEGGRNRKNWLAAFALLGIVAVFGLVLIDRGHWVWAGLTFFIGTVGYYGASILYNSLLPEVSDRNSSHIVSGIGFAAGYLGGAILFVTATFFLQEHRNFGVAEKMTAMHIIFVVAAIWRALFTLPP
ncbi:MAG: MFS transporter [Myxococcota bacterium]|nr:MFS transporter [Myxococcota bacterium]